jgi:hypothetical protein
METSVPLQMNAILSYCARIELSSSPMERNGGHRGSTNWISELGPSVELGQQASKLNFLPAANI